MPDSVLLIDDDESVLRAIGAYLEKLGAEVHREATGQAGIETFERVRPDVVILDLHLPDAGGLDVLERLKSQGASVILLTGHGDIDTAGRGVEPGAQPFFTQPVRINHPGAPPARGAGKGRRRGGTPRRGG